MESAPTSWRSDRLDVRERQQRNAHIQGGKHEQQERHHTQAHFPARPPRCRWAGWTTGSATGGYGRSSRACPLASSRPSSVSHAGL
jgi:hypothetical protein